MKLWLLSHTDPQSIPAPSIAQLLATSPCAATEHVTAPAATWVETAVTSDQPIFLLIYTNFTLGNQ